MDNNLEAFIQDSVNNCLDGLDRCSKYAITDVSSYVEQIKQQNIITPFFHVKFLDYTCTIKNFKISKISKYETQCLNNNDCPYIENLIYHIFNTLRSNKNHFNKVINFTHLAHFTYQDLINWTVPISISNYQYYYINGFSQLLNLKSLRFKKSRNLYIQVNCVMYECNMVKLFEFITCNKIIYLL